MSTIASDPRVFKRKLTQTAGTKVYIVTAAQNGTPEHPVWWNIIKQIQKHRKAEIMVIPLRYKNPTSRWEQSQANEERWADVFVPYLWNVRKNLNENLVVLGDVKVQATATDPLTGFDAITGGASAILGHTKVGLRCIAAPANKMAKILTSTGACTVANYSDTRAGKTGEFHHSLSAVIVEVSGRKFSLRHVHYDEKSQSATNLNVRYYENRVTKAPRPLAVVTGDMHVDFVSKSLETATFGRGGIVDTLNPRHLVYHDLLDNFACNPHHAGNPFAKIAKMMSGKSSVENEVRRACEFVRERTKGDMISVVVPSNHDEFFTRWIISNDWRLDPRNAEFYLATALEMVRGTRLTERGAEFPSPLPMVFPSMVPMDGIKVLQRGDSFVLGGVECGFHGDKGPNGSRGSAKNMRRIGVKSIIGHVHSPAIEEGCVAVGTSSNLVLEYTIGSPSGWLPAHCVLHEDGKRQLIFVIDGHWRFN